MQFLVIDDNPKTAAALTGLLEQYPGTTEVFRAIQPYLVRSLIAAERVDVIFSRVRLWNYRPFSQLEQVPPVVFLYGGRERLTMREATRVAYQFGEPYQLPALRSLLGRIQAEGVTEDPNYFFVRYENRHHRIFFSEIELIERLPSKYVRLHTKDMNMVLPGSLISFLHQLPEDRFQRVSDGLVLPTQRAVEIRNDCYHFKGRIIPLTYRFKAGFHRQPESAWGIHE